MTIKENISLAEYTTFKIGGPARFFCTVKNEAELVEAVKFAKDKIVSIMVLGGGSNILICDDGYPGLVIKNEMKGIDILNDSPSADAVVISVASGENWDSFVDYAVRQGLYGIENLSAIPGSVGATPVQNIGAYGTDISHTIQSVHAFDTRFMKFVELLNKECQFGYRDSIFKHERGRYIIAKVTLKLHKKGVLNTDYKDVKEYFVQKNITDPTLAQVRQAVVDIRTAKLPDWTKWGTAGSFFKNPTVSAEKFAELKAKYPEIPGFPEPSGAVKISLGWILDKVCDARGLTLGNVGTYGNQALVLVAKPGAKSIEVMNFSRELMKRVKEKTGIDVECEVEWVC